MNGLGWSPPWEALLPVLVTGCLWIGPAHCQQAKPTDDDVNRAFMVCSLGSRTDAQVESGLNLLKGRILSGEGKFSHSEIPSVIGSGVQSDSAKIDLFDRIQKCVVEKIYGAALPVKPPTAPHIVILKFVVNQEGPQQDQILVRRAHVEIFNDGEAAAEACSVIWTPLIGGGAIAPTSSQKFGIAPKEHVQGDLTGYITARSSPLNLAHKVDGISTVYVECKDNSLSDKVERNVDYESKGFSD